MASWDAAVDEIEYQAVGFGSHHWLARRGPEAWFVTVDDLDARLLDDDDVRAAAQTRLTAALATARTLRDAGHTWVVAPVRSLGGKVIEAIDERFVCALYPFVAGRTSSWGAYKDADQRRAVVELLAKLHRADPGVALPALADDHVIPRRDSLEEAMNDAGGTWTGGPFAESARKLLAQDLHAVAAVLERYDELVETVSRRASPVVTHGEPHRGNVIVTEDGPALIDWDTTRIAPPERDLWSLIVEDPKIRQFYEARAETTLDDSALRLYELWWDLCEIALFIHDFRQPHSRTDDTTTAWSGLTTHLDPSRWHDILGSSDRT